MFVCLYKALLNALSINLTALESYSDQELRRLLKEGDKLAFGIIYRRGCPDHLASWEFSGMVSMTKPLSSIITLIESTGTIKVKRKEGRAIVIE